tara:strand:- start:130 stop:456 length:327 start_codon:yes stop_codon:yes gene_type:complete
MVLITDLENADKTVITAATTEIDTSNTNATTELGSKNEVLLNKEAIQQNQIKEIKDKEKLLLTRSRMLQISQDRNSYKTKILYSLIAILIVIFIINLFIWTMRKKNTQ